MNLLGQRALVTGGSRGLGLAIATSIASRGANVTLVARDEKLLSQLAMSLPVISPSQVHNFISADLIKYGQDEYPTLTESMKEISILINCAGKANHSLLARASSGSIADTIHLNLTVPILLSKLAVKQMLRKRNASDFKPVIINISSILSVTGTMVPGTTVYAASKAGLVGFTTSLANELRGKVRVNAVLPGLVRETDMGRLFNIDDVVETCTVSEVSQAAMDLIENENKNGQCVICASGVSESSIGLQSDLCQH